MYIIIIKIINICIYICIHALGAARCFPAILESALALRPEHVRDAMLAEQTQGLSEDVSLFTHLLQLALWYPKGLGYTLFEVSAFKIQTFNECWNPEPQLVGSKYSDPLVAKV